MPHQLTYASALPGKTKKCENCIFPQCCISALPEFNELLDFFSLFDSQLILMLLYGSLSLVMNAFSYREYWGHGSRRKEVDSAAAVGLLHTQCTSALSSGFLISQGNVEALGKQRPSDFLLSQ